jgi:hypothetical protein
LKQIRKRLTYANVMSSIAVFMVLGGATAFAATKIGANEIKANSIKTGKIVKEAVTAGKIKNGAVTTTKIGKGAVGSENLADNSVTSLKIAPDAVTTAKIAPDAVTTGKIANGAVTSAKIGAGAISASKLASIQRVLVESTATNAVGQTREVTAQCPAGTVAISGGAAWVTTAGNVSTVNGIIRVSQPVPSTAGAGAPTGWQATGETDAAFERRLRAYAICIGA